MDLSRHPSIKNGAPAWTYLGCLVPSEEEAVVEGTTTTESLKQALKGAVSDARVVPVASAAEGLAALEGGKVDAFASDQIVLIGLVFADECPEKSGLVGGSVFLRTFLLGGSPQ